MRRSVVLNEELDPSAERVQDSVGRKDNGVEQLVLNINMYKGDASETRITISLLYKSRAYNRQNYSSRMKPWSATGNQVEESCREVGDSNLTPRGCEDDLFVRLTAVWLRNSTTAILRSHEDSG